MKNFIKSLLFGFVIVGMTACEKDTELTVLENVVFPATPKLSSTELVLVQEEQTQPALNISWEEVIFPIDAPVDYSVQFTVGTDTVGENTWQNALNQNAGTNVFSKSFSGLDINQMAGSLGLEAGVEGNILTRVVARLDRNVASEPVGLTITPFTTIITQTQIYLPGTYQGWDPSTALGLPATEVSGVYQGLMSFPLGALDFKVTLDRNWDDNYGDDDSGNLVFDAANNLEVPAPGTYQIRVDLNNLIWSAETYSFGIIGTATPGGWDVDSDMMYQPETQTWFTEQYLAAGALKFRLNDEWTVNYGSRNNDEGIAYFDDQGAHDIALPGMYEVSFRIDPEDSSRAFYSVTPVNWGIVGDATAGGWDVDTDMTYDPTANVWMTTAELAPGALKFRKNDEWTINYGPRNSDDGILYLDDPGAHTITEAGTYTVTFAVDASDSSVASYEIERIN